MARKIVIRVVKLVELLDARARVEAGDFEGGAQFMTDFCHHNRCMQGDHGVEWGEIKLAALKLRALAVGEAMKAQIIIGNLWKRIFPKLTEAYANGRR